MTGRLNPYAWSPRALGAAAAAATGGILLLSRLLPSAEGGPVLCLFRAVTTLPCPSCGMTRAFVALGHGDISSALHFNLASPAVFAAAGILFVLSIFQAVWNRPILPTLWRAARRPVAAVAILLMGAAWVFNLAHRLHFTP